MASDLKKYCEYLNILATKEPNDKQRNEVLEAAQSKLEGVQITAARILAAWGDKESIEIVKNMLYEKATTPGRYSATCTIAEALYARVNENDIEWILELYLKKTPPQDRFALLGLVGSLPKKKTKHSLDYYLNNPAGVNPKDVREAYHAISIVISDDMPNIMNGDKGRLKKLTVKKRKMSK